MDVHSYLGWSRYAYLKFDLSAIPAGATITSANLSLYATGLPATPRVLAARKVTSNWAENTLTWKNRPGLSSAATAATGTPAAPDWMDWDVKADVQAIVSGAANYGWAILDSVERSASPQLTRFHSKEFGTPGLRPKLVITYTP